MDSNSLKVFSNHAVSISIEHNEYFPDVDQVNKDIKTLDDLETAQNGVALLFDDNFKQTIRHAKKNLAFLTYPSIQRSRQQLATISQDSLVAIINQINTLIQQLPTTGRKVIQKHLYYPISQEQILKIQQNLKNKRETLEKMQQQYDFHSRSPNYALAFYISNPNWALNFHANHENNAILCTIKQNYLYLNGNPIYPSENLKPYVRRMKSTHTYELFQKILNYSGQIMNHEWMQWETSKPFYQITSQISKFIELRRKRAPQIHLRYDIEITSRFSLQEKSQISLNNFMNILNNRSRYCKSHLSHFFYQQRPNMAQIIQALNPSFTSWKIPESYYTPQHLICLQRIKCIPKVYFLFPKQHKINLEQANTFL